MVKVFPLHEANFSLIAFAIEISFSSHSISSTPMV